MANRVSAFENDQFFAIFGGACDAEMTHFSCKQVVFACCFKVS